MATRFPIQHLLGKEIADIVRRHGISRTALAEQMGVTLDTINNWCSGRTRIGIGHLHQLLELLERRGHSPTRLRDLLKKYLEAYGVSPHLLDQLFAASSDHFTANQDFVACICTDRRNSTVERICEGIIETFTRYGFKNLLVLDVCGKPQLFDYCIGEITRARPIGVLFNDIPLAQPSVDLIARLLSRENIAGVFIYSVPTPDACEGGRISWGCSQAEILANHATQLLLERGHSRIAIILQTTSDSRLKFLAGYRQALEHAGIEYDPTLVSWGIDFLGFPSIEEVLVSEYQQQVIELVRNNEVTGLIATSPVAALQIITAMRRELQAWPGDKSIVVIGQNEWLKHLVSPPFTSVLPAADIVGRQAAELLVQMCSRFGGQHTGRGVAIQEVTVEHLEDGSIKDLRR